MLVFFVIVPNLFLLCTHYCGLRRKLPTYLLPFIKEQERPELVRAEITEFKGTRGTARINASELNHSKAFYLGTSGISHLKIPEYAITKQALAQYQQSNVKLKFENLTYSLVSESFEPRFELN